MKKVTNRISMKERDRASHLLPVRVTEHEFKQIRRAAERSGDRFMTRFMRRVVMEAVKK